MLSARNEFYRNSIKSVFIFPYWDGILKKLRHNYLNKRKGNKEKKKV